MKSGRTRFSNETIWRHSRLLNSLNAPRRQFPQRSCGNGMPFAQWLRKNGGSVMRSSRPVRLRRHMHSSARRLSLACRRPRREKPHASRVTLWDEIARPAPAPLPLPAPADAIGLPLRHRMRTPIHSRRPPRASSRNRTSTAYRGPRRPVCAPSPGGHFFIHAVPSRGARRDRRRRVGFRTQALRRTRRCIAKCAASNARLAGVASTLAVMQPASVTHRRRSRRRRAATTARYARPR